MNADEILMLQQASQAGKVQIGVVLDRHRARLKRMVELRLDRRIRGRVDASDVIQESQIEAVERIDEYLADPAVPLFVWLRFLTLQKVSQFHRQHLGTQCRDANRELSLFRHKMPAATSAALAAKLVGKLTTASQAAVRSELKTKIANVLGEMSEKDRDVLVLLHFEQLSHKETAAVLEISEKAVGGRYVRALSRLKKLLSPTENVSGGEGGLNE